jgi:hypothetical protein
MHVMYENFVRPRGETTLSYDATSLFDDEFEDDVSFVQRSLTRFMRIKRAHFGMKYSVQVCDATPAASLQLAHLRAETAFT